VRLSPDARPEGDEEGVISLPMTCHSGGTLEIYVEPFAPPPRLLVLGESPVAEALVALAPLLGFSITAQPDPAAPLAMLHPADTWVVLAGMGSSDDLAAEAALAAGAAYVALVASRRRAAGILEYLRERGLGDLAGARLKAPAGLDIGARTGAEVALSILAEIVQRRRNPPMHPDALPKGGEREGSPPRIPFTLPPGEGQGEGPSSSPTTAIDPVCQMEVEIATARWTSKHEGRAIYFCAPGCKRRFDRDPVAYAPLPAGRP
jgi:xanthine dehydrogenase accessory factor